MQCLQLQVSDKESQDIVRESMEMLVSHNPSNVGGATPASRPSAACLTLQAK